MTGRYTGKVALITGGASGLGLAVARQMSAEGAHLVLVDWDASSLDAAADGIQHSGGEVRRLTGDVSEAATATAGEEVIDHYVDELAPGAEATNGESFVIAAEVLIEVSFRAGETPKG